MPSCSSSGERSFPASCASATWRLRWNRWEKTSGESRSRISPIVSEASFDRAVELAVESVGCLGALIRRAVRDHMQVLDALRQTGPEAEALDYRRLFVFEQCKPLFAHPPKDEYLAVSRRAT